MPGVTEQNRSQKEEKWQHHIKFRERSKATSMCVRVKASVLTLSQIS